LDFQTNIQLKMKNLLYTTGILLMVLMASCQSGKSSKGQKGGDSDEGNDSTIVQKSYHTTGGLWKVNRAKKVEVDGESKYVLHGEVLEYYKTPKNALSSKAIYKNGKREGLFTKYYTDGKVYYTINYHDGKMNGIKKSYHTNGKLMAETPYKNGLIGLGTKEYTPDGNLISRMEMKVWTEKSGNSTIVYAQMLNNGKPTKRVTFYEGALDEGKYSVREMVEIPMTGATAQKLVYNTPTTITISGKARSAYNNYTLLSKTIKVN